MALFHIEHHHDKYHDKYHDQNPDPCRHSDTSWWRTARSRSVAQTSARKAGSSSDLAFLDVDR